MSSERITAFVTRRPWVVAGVMLVTSIIIVAMVAVPSLWPAEAPFLNGVRVDTDPENMLDHDEPVRVFHDRMKKTLSLYDMLVVGVVNNENPNGVFNAASLGRIHALATYAKSLKGEALGLDDPRAGVIGVDLIAPSTVDNIEPGGLGEVRFEWLMKDPPKTDEEALAVRDKAARLPFLEGTLVSEDGKAVALYIPLSSKDLSYEVSAKLKAKIAELGGDDEYHITGLPVAEDTFGVEMFIQMGISAPMAMLVIFLLLLFFFRKLTLIISPMIVAIVSVIGTMGALIITGNTVHIMSSMIPIFIMPIAVLDSIHILSDFFDRYQQTRDRKKTITAVMADLHMPMLYTSLTSAAGFASLALTPIPPVQVFGVFVSLGIMLAWVLTITFIPAYVMFLPERTLANFGAKNHEDEENTANATLVGRILRMSGAFTNSHARFIVAGALLLAAVSVYGISQIQINDNPTRWFKKTHEIRIADKVLNEHFAGTYMAYLALTPGEGRQESLSDYTEGMFARLDAKAGKEAGDVPEYAAVAAEAKKQLGTLVAGVETKTALLDAWETYARKKYDDAGVGEDIAWDDLIAFIDGERQRDEIFKQPEVLRYMARLQEALLATGVVGKSNSLADLVKTVHRELFEGKEAYYRIPDSARAVAECLITYQGGHRPNDLWHFVTPDYRTSSLWIQLNSGDNRDMSAVVASLDDFVAKNPPPMGLETRWFGLTYINVIWQEKMVSGMLQAFLGSFLVVFLMMTILYRSALWGILSMIPLTLTVGLSYGVIGLIGKDYDMPVAVLSSLSLGLAVDFAIHFLSRTRALYEKYGHWAATSPHVFGEPARAITRNVLVIAIGFLPLLAAPLLPYVTVGFFLAAILAVSGAATLLLLPALIHLGEPMLFPKTRPRALACQRGTCIIAALAFAALVAVNVHQFMGLGINSLAGTAIAAMVAWMGGCWIVGRIYRCGLDPIDDEQ